MRRFTGSFALAAICALGIAVHAQDTRTKTTTETKGNAGQSMTYTGCVQTGTESQSYVLDKVVPLSRTTTTDATGTSTVTTYALVPGDRVEIQSHVGQKVEVTGMLVPAGESRTETRTKTEREGAPDSNSRETTKTKSNMPQFRVMSIKNVGSC
jgi:hypothetical protein